MIDYYHNLTDDNCTECTVVLWTPFFHRQPTVQNIQAARNLPPLPIFPREVSRIMSRNIGCQLLARPGVPGDLSDIDI